MQNSGPTRVLVIGAGLAGSEAAMFLARHGIHVVLLETKALKLNPAQKIPTFAELVCTNSLKSLDPYSAHGLLKSEMKAIGSFIIESAEKHAVPAGDALAVDRDLFSAEVTEKLKADIEKKAKKFLDGHKKELNTLQGKIDKLMKAAGKLKAKNKGPTAAKTAAPSKKKVLKKVAAAKGAKAGFKKATTKKAAPKK